MSLKIKKKNMLLIILIGCLVPYFFLFEKLVREKQILNLKKNLKKRKFIIF